MAGLQRKLWRDEKTVLSECGQKLHMLNIIESDKLHITRQNTFSYFKTVSDLQYVDFFINWPGWEIRRKIFDEYTKPGFGEIRFISVID